MQQSQKQSKPKKNSAANEKSGKKIVTEGKGFWELMESSLKGILTPVEINRFLAALRQVVLSIFYLFRFQIYSISVNCNIPLSSQFRSIPTFMKRLLYMILKI